jgi:hypothetical protein
MPRLVRKLFVVANVVQIPTLSFSGSNLFPHDYFDFYQAWRFTFLFASLGKCHVFIDELTGEKKEVG